MNLEQTSATSNLLEELLLKKVHIKKDWDLIKEQFCKTYPLFFFEYIKSKIELTTNEEQLLVLEKLGFNSKDIANLLNVLPESVHKSRYRLKKKLNSKQQSA